MSELSKALDAVENSSKRAHDAKKDVDLLVALRALDILLRDRIRNGGKDDRGTTEQK